MIALLAWQREQFGRFIDFAAPRSVGDPGRFAGTIRRRVLAVRAGGDPEFADRRGSGGERGPRHLVADPPLAGGSWGRICSAGVPRCRRRGGDRARPRRRAAGQPDGRGLAAELGSMISTRRSTPGSSSAPIPCQAWWLHTIACAVAVPLLTVVIDAAARQAPRRRADRGQDVAASFLA